MEMFFIRSCILYQSQLTNSICDYQWRSQEVGMHASWQCHTHLMKGEHPSTPVAIIQSPTKSDNFLWRINKLFENHLYHCDKICMLQDETP